MTLLDHYRLTRTTPPDYEAMARTSYRTIIVLAIIDVLLLAPIALVAVWCQ